jgi:hypothetical protein
LVGAIVLVGATVLVGDTVVVGATVVAGEITATFFHCCEPGSKPIVAGQGLAHNNSEYVTQSFELFPLSKVSE